MAAREKQTLSVIPAPMSENRVIRLFLLAACVLSVRPAPAQSGQVSGLYQILSGRYGACCGLGGNDSGYTLPAATQSYVRLTVNAQQNTASLAFLADDRQTVFSIAPCAPAETITFRFDYGLVFSNQLVFQVDPGPPPYYRSWNYTVSNAPNTLRIEGILGSQSSCTDTPTRFTHSNVVARLVLGPQLTLLEFSKERGARLMVQGRAGATNVIEASADLLAWTPVSTNVMDYSLCPICPFVIFEDAASTNLTLRFYRAVELP